MFKSYRDYKRRKPKKLAPIGIKNKLSKQLREKIKNSIIEGHSENSRFTAERIALSFKVRTHLIRQILHELNLEGYVSKKYNNPPHDSTRDYWCCNGVSSWQASYYIYTKLGGEKCRI
jgi:hypothetical protein